jgi:hypothetical protein
MKIDENTPPSPDKGPERKIDLEEVINSIKPALEAHPEAQKIPPAALDADEYEESARKALSAGLHVCTTPNEHMVIGGEFIQRSTLLAGRVGIRKDRRVLSILYRSTSKRLRAFVFYPSARIDARDLGKWILWGIVTDIPENLVQSEIITLEDFLRINACDFARLLQDPLIAFEISKLRSELNQIISEEETARRKAEASNAMLCDKLDERNEALETLAKNHEEETTRALRWQLTALGSIALLVFTVIAVFLGG